MKKWQISTEIWEVELEVMMNLKYPMWILHNWPKWWRLVLLSFIRTDSLYLQTEIGKGTENTAKSI